MQDGITEKYIDEAIQGEALMIEDLSNLPKKKLYLESYGCAMNFSDSEIVASIMTANGYTTTKNLEEADAVFINTCAIRDNAEVRIRGRLAAFNVVKKTRP